MAADLVQNVMAAVPESNTALLGCLTTPNEMAPSVNSLLSRAVESFLSKEYDSCVQLCEPLLDLTWEKLNTGHWKDVHLCWRYLYSLVSLLKGASEVVIATIRSENTGNDVIKNNLANSIKTFDMGLLMGAPIFGNVLSKLSLHVHDWLGTNSSFQTPGAELTSSGKKLIQSDNLTENEDAKSTRLCCQCSEMCKEGNCEHFENISKKPKMEITNIKIKSKNQIKRVRCPSMELFRKEYLCSKHPVIITDAMGHWPAMGCRRWSLDYLKKIAGYRTVPIEIGSKYTDDKWTQKLMTVSEFIDQFITADMSRSNDVTGSRLKQDKPVGYLAQHQLFNQIPELQDDIVIPDYCVLGGTGSTNPETSDDDVEEVDINAWFGPKGTVSPLHHDPKENFLAQVVGRKYIRLYSEVMTPYLYPHDGFMDNTSQVDAVNPDYAKFPRFKNATYRECVLEEGEMLFIPQKCWHYVRSLSVSFSVSFWWK
ncbi:lysine-specific demethylase 8-like isoform X2 [Mizuhopecten yessoensis]|uniref:JmjC domain-containing protein 5 n=2 Tax=Mizuhopecten yessoensis TaxID=6573 RepID=A0A210R214_MIZYE|nr:lysine-specific demethylase 8-like isoform X2 [Mizuhopecten yessoensis]XP_021373799.1 lysine-specific demethylase 8-like isoform X2 [Mizuhopecten yessoensis]OWF55130.1 Lysine-specific demethylase 8 [Mizuhopecten yessoensis]